MHFQRETLSFPPSISKTLESFFELDKGRNIEILGESLKKLWPQLAKDLGKGSEKHYAKENAFARTYAAYYLPVNMMKIPLEFFLQAVFSFQGRRSFHTSYS